MISTSTPPQGGEAAKRRLDGVTGTLQKKQAEGGGEMLVDAGIALVLTSIVVGLAVIVRRLLRTKADEAALAETVRRRISPTVVDTPSSEVALVSTSEADAIDRRIHEWAAAEANRAAGAGACLLERVKAGSAAVLVWRQEDGGTLRATGVVTTVDRRGATFETEIPVTRESIGKDALLVVFDQRGGAGIHAVAPAAERGGRAGPLRLAASAPGVELAHGVRRPCEITGQATLANGDEVPFKLIACGLGGAIGKGAPPANVGAELELWSSFEDGGEAEAVRCVVVESPAADDGERRFAVAFRSPGPDLRARIAVRMFRAAAAEVGH